MLQIQKFAGRQAITKYLVLFAWWLTFQSSAANAYNADVTELPAAPLASIELLEKYYPGHQGVQSKAASIPLSRAEVTALYQSLWLSGQTVTFTWAGATTPTCNPGNTPLAVQTASLNRINFYRRLVGLPDVSAYVMSDANAQAAQASSLMQATNSWASVSPHFPPTTWNCYTAIGAAAAGKSNLYKGVSGPSAIDGYVDDYGSSNNVVGHRRWILYPPLAKIYSADVTTSTAFPYNYPTSTPSNTLWVIPNGSDGTWGSRPSGSSWVAWPPDGYVPYKVLPTSSNRWSFSYPNATMTNATVNITRNGLNIPVMLYDSRDNLGYGDASIVFQPNNLAVNGATVRYTTPGAAEDTYEVTVSGMTGTGIPASVSYTVRVFDPDSLIAPDSDFDNDGIPYAVEIAEGRNPAVKDNAIFAGTHANANRWFAMQQYRDFLAREGDAAGISNWTNVLNNNSQDRAQVMRGFFDSAEFQNQFAPLARLYLAYFNRFPDYAGLMSWVVQRKGGMSIEAVSQNFANSTEFTNRYGSVSNAQFVSLCYQNVLGRAPDTAGYNGWLNAINAGTMTRGQVMLSFAESTEHKASSYKQVAVTMAYVGMLRRSPEIAGYNNWLGLLNSGSNINTLLAGFISSNEYRNRFLPPQ